MGVGGIYIREGEEDPEQAVEKEEQPLPAALQNTYDKVKVKDPAKVKISESVRKRVAQGVQYLYQDTNSADFTNASRSITDDLLKAIEDNDAVAVDIGALKVSDEYTFKHSVDVATMAMIVARKYGLNDKQIYQIGIAGLLHYAPGRAACEIRHLAVRADCRGQGLAQRLLGMLRARTGGQKCTVWARQGNTPAERLYEKNDFRPDGWTSVVLRLD